MFCDVVFSIQARKTDVFFSFYVLTLTQTTVDMYNLLSHMRQICELRTVAEDDGFTRDFKLIQKSDFSFCIMQSKTK